MSGRRRFPRLVAAAALVAVGVLGAVLPQFAASRAAFSRWVFAPASAFSAVGSGLTGLWSRPASDAVAQLRTERDALVVENARLRSDAQEAEELRALVAYRERSRADMVAARVIGRSTDLDEQAVIIDRGSDDGIAPGMAVVVGDGFYIGTVRKAAPTHAVVLLALDSRNRVAAMLQNGSRTIGYVEGGRGLGMALRLIPQEEKVEAGQLIVTSGLDAAVPRGLIIGRVDRVSREPQEPFQTAVISQMVAAERRMDVAVLRTSAVDHL